MKTIRAIFFLPNLENPSERQTAQLLRIILVLFSLVSLFYGIANSLADPSHWERYAGQAGFLLLGMVVGLAFLRRGYVRWVAAFEILLIWLVFTAAAYTGGGIRSSGYIGYLVVLVVAGVLSGRRLGVLVVALACVAVGYILVQAEQNGILPPPRVPMTPFALWLDSLVYFAVISLLLFLAMTLLENALARIHRELTERQRAEARLIGILENTPDLILEMDRQGVILFSNRPAAGYEGKRVHDYLPTGSDGWADSMIRQVFETGQSLELEAQTREVNGSFGWNLVRVGPIHAAGRVERLVLISTNIHAQKEAELQLRKHTEQLGTILEIGHTVSNLQDLDHALDVIYHQVRRIAPADVFFIALLRDDRTLTFPITYDMDTRYQEPDLPLNPNTRVAQVIATGRHIRYHRTPQELDDAGQTVSHGIGDSTHKSSSLLFLPLWQANRVIGVLSVQSYEPYAYSDELVETLTGISHQVAVAIQNSQLYTNVQRELNERRLAEEKQESLIRELGQRNAELERLAYTLSHELKSPLITIRGFLGYLREDAVKGDLTRLERDVRRITDATEKMLRLINELIELMSVGRLIHTPRDLSLREVALEAVELVRENLERHHVTVHVAEDLPHLHGDHKRLLEVFQNLIENAIKFMGSQPEPRIEIGQRSGADSEPVFYVRDNGIGIEPRFHERVFGIFHKLDIASEGTGIGLALVKRIIEVHGGGIWIESEGNGTGAAFCFTLPQK